jgi:hypothetical protein
MWDVNEGIAMKPRTIGTAALLAALCAIAAPVSTAGVLLAQAAADPVKNPLDGQDRIRDQERQRAHDDVRTRLGDRSRDPDRDRASTAPGTYHIPDAPAPRPEPPQER